MTFRMNSNNTCLAVILLMLHFSWTTLFSHALSPWGSQRIRWSFNIPTISTGLDISDLNLYPDFCTAVVCSGHFLSATQ